MLDNFFLLWYNKGTKRQGENTMNEQELEMLVAQWEQENQDQWARYEVQV